MKLKPKEKAAIRDGQFPEIIRLHEGKCPFEVGEEISIRSRRSIAGLTPLISITITGRHRKNAKTWQALYSVRDDRGLYLAPGAGYTRSASASIDWTAPVLDPDAQTKYAMQGRLSMAERHDRDSEAMKAQARAARSELTETLNNLDGEVRTEWLADFRRMCMKVKNQTEEEA